MIKLKEQLIFLSIEISNIKDPHLISIGMLTNNGEKIYLERNDYNKDVCSSFVKNNVETQFSSNGFTLNEISKIVFNWLAMLKGRYKIICSKLIEWQLLIDFIEKLPNNIDSNVNLIYNDLELQCILIGMKNKNSRDLTKKIFNIFHLAKQNFYNKNSLSKYHALNNVMALNNAYLVIDCYLKKEIYKSNSLL